MPQANLGRGYLCLDGTLEIGYTKYTGFKGLQCWPFADMLSPDNVWYGRLKLLFSIPVKVDGKREPVQLACGCVSFFRDIKLDPSCKF